jgi:hypothetical protein
MTQEVALTATSPAVGIGQSYAELLADLMWVLSVDWDAVWTPAGVPVEGLFRIRGTIKANPKSPSLEGWMNSVTRNYLRILKVITEAGGVYAELPGWTLRARRTTRWTTTPYRTGRTCGHRSRST